MFLKYLMTDYNIENLSKNIFKFCLQIFVAILYLGKMLNTIFVDLGFLIRNAIITMHLIS